MLLRDPTSSLMDSEWKAKITKPESLFEKQNDGSLLLPIYCWFAFYDSAESAFLKLKHLTSESLLRDKEKRKAINPSAEVDFSLSELDDIMSKVQIIKL